MLYSGTDPESNITEYTLVHVYADKRQNFLLRQATSCALFELPWRKAGLLQSSP